MPCCVAVLVAFIGPRIAMIVIRLVSHWFTDAFETWYWPLLGWIFLPYTTLIYMLFMVFNHHDLGTLGTVFVVLGVLIDIGVIGGGSRHRHVRTASD